MPNVRLRHVDYVGTAEYPQGAGMNWNELEIEVVLADDERIQQIDTGKRGGSFDMLIPTARVWVAQEVPSDA